jgi:hypothetical protein
MQLVPAHDHDRRPMPDPFQIGMTIGALLAALKSMFRHAAQPRDTSIAWEDGETDRQDQQG